MVENLCVWKSAAPCAPGRRVGAVALFGIMAVLCASADVAAQEPATIVEASTPAPEAPTPQANTPGSSEADPGSMEVGSGSAELASDPAETDSGSAEINSDSAEITSGSAEIDWELQELQGLIERAHFRVARRLAESTRENFESLPAGASDPQRARLDVLSATVELAFGQKTAALDHMRAALRADPGLRLEPTTTSPKVVAVLEAARSELEGGPHEPAEPEEK